ncbi:biotin-dependent carboxyltransferase family protein [Oryzobacter terrae]|uniref:5-oxoprolinase subunit C family protein n=1 Tax=Oryzobacter terrae TaxID=1620385 RepID=UPI0036703428
MVEVLDPGLQTTVQAWPGRLGLTAYGYSPAGPMDSVSFRAANVLVGNPPGAAALEVPLIGLTVVFLRDAQIALTGPESTAAFIEDTPISLWETISVKAGDILRTSSKDGPGFRLYLAIAGGIDVPSVYGSAATSLVAGLGGVEGRALVRGDILRSPQRPPIARRKLPDSLRPRFSTAWEVEVIEGPFARPDYLTEDDWTTLTTQTWRVDLNSDRIGTRLHPHRFDWARPDGGRAGGHPSNILDSAYPVGGILANGDVLTILGADTNTSGGFAVVATVASCAMWKVGQMRPGRDTVTFREISFAEAQDLKRQVEFAIQPERMVQS